MSELKVFEKWLKEYRKNPDPVKGHWTDKDMLAAFEFSHTDEKTQRVVEAARVVDGHGETRKFSADEELRNSLIALDGGESQ